MGHAEGDHRPCPHHHEGQDHSPPGAQVLCLDWRLHSCLALDLPADVDLQGRVRRVWPLHCPPQVLLSASSSDTRTQLAYPQPKTHTHTHTHTYINQNKNFLSYYQKFKK